MPYDRDDVLARTDLAELCDEVLGARRGRGGSATWSCPAPGHGPQTGRTPPVSVFRSGSGDERWHCHACGAGGTAIDLVMTSEGVGFLDALEVLGRRAGADERDRRQAPARARVPTPGAPVPGPPSPEVERYVAACEAHLWSARGQPFRRWLAGRGLAPAVLRANRVGADPGPAVLARARGLPRGGAAVVLPVLGSDGRARYLQARYLRGHDRRYENPATSLVGASPRLGEVRLPRPPGDPGLVVVCEGLPDALSAAQAGVRAVAVLGTGQADRALAAELVARFADARLVIAFDADAAGRTGAARLAALLDDAGARRPPLLAVPEAAGDLNGWLQARGGRFADELAAALERATSPPARATSLRPARALGAASATDALETLLYREVLVDDDPAARRRLRRVAETVTAWAGGREPAAAPGAATGTLEGMLADWRYRYALGDDRGREEHVLRAATEVVERWGRRLAPPALAPSLRPVGPSPRALRAVPAPAPSLER